MLGVQLHTIVTHFPIALTVALFIFDAWGRYSGDSRKYGTGSALTPLAAAAAALAVGTGFSLAGVSGLGSGGAVTGHAGLGVLSTIVIGTLMFMRYSSEARGDSPEEVFSDLWLGVELLAVILVGATTIIGHRM